MKIADFDEQEQNSSEPETTPVVLAKEAEEPASVAYVKRELNRKLASHRGDCDATRAIRKWRLWIAAGIGAALVVQFGWLMAGRAIIRETVRDVVREELAGRTVARQPAMVPSIISTATAAEVEREPPPSDTN